MAVLREGSPNRICLHHAGVDGVPADLTALKKRLAGYEVTHSKKEWAETIKTKGEHGYNYIEYHRAIAGNGHELVLQDDKYVLYHAGDNARGKDSFNLHGIAVLVDGNYMNDKPTALQSEAFARIIARFEKQYKVDVLVRGHKQTSLTGTSCPGTNLGDNTKGFLKDAITRANEIVKNNLPTNPIQDDAPVTPPEAPEITELKKKVESLTQEVSTLQSGAKKLEEDKKKLTSDLKSANDEIITLKAEGVESGKEITRLETEYKKSELDRIEAVSQLNEYKANAIKKVIEQLKDWFGGILEKILNKD
jgi:hypothetical protein